MRYTGKKIVADIFLDIFGEGALDKVSIEAREFLGIGDLQLESVDTDLDF
jgi:hypothetical protein